jgi:glycerate kinase
VANHDLGVDLRDEPGAGAAGGLGFGLMAFCGARLRRGAELVMDAVKLEERVARADVILTGEGSFDPSSLSGKVPGFLMELAAIAGKPIAVICGRAELRPEGTEIVSLEELVGRERAVREAAWSVVDAAAALAERAARIREGRINA